MSAPVAASDRRLPNQCVQDHEDDGYEHATTDPDQGSKEQSCIRLCMAPEVFHDHTSSSGNGFSEGDGMMMRMLSTKGSAD
jgi:hypothetical protein